MYIDSYLTTTSLGTNNEKATVDAKYEAAQTQYNSDLVVYNQALADYPAKLNAYNDALAAYNAARNSRGFRHKILTEPTAPEVPVAPALPVYSEIMASVDNGGSDVKIVGSNIFTTTNGANIVINASDSVNIASAVDSAYKMETSNKKGRTSQSSSKDIALDLVNISSNLSSLGDINIASGNNTKIIASNLSGTNGNILVGKHIDRNPLSATYGQEIINNDAKLTIKSGEDLHYVYHESTKIKTDSTAMVVGAVAAVAVVVATGGTGAVAIAGAAAGGGLTGAQGKKGKTTTSETAEITQKQSNLNFSNDLNIQSASDTTITASNLTADNATILTGKFRDQNTNIETAVNSDAKLTLNSALNTYDNKTKVEKVTPNYLGIAVVSAGSVYAGYKLNKYLTTKGLPYVVDTISVIGGISSSKNTNPQNSGGPLDFLYNIRTGQDYKIHQQNEINTNLNFNNLTLE